MDLLMLQHDGKYVAKLEEDGGGDTPIFLKRFYHRLAKVSSIMPGGIPPRNESLVGDDLAAAKRERCYIWQLLTSELLLPVVPQNATELCVCDDAKTGEDGAADPACSACAALDARFEAEDELVEEWLVLRDRYLALMGQIGDVEVVLGRRRRARGPRVLRRADASSPPQGCA